MYTTNDMYYSLYMYILCLLSTICIVYIVSSISFVSFTIPFMSLMAYSSCASYFRLLCLTIARITLASAQPHIVTCGAPFGRPCGRFPEKLFGSFTRNLVLNIYIAINKNGPTVAPNNDSPKGSQK